MSKYTDFLVKLALNAVAVIIASFLLSGGVHIDGFWYAVMLAAVLAVLNASVKPVLIFFTLPATIVTLGLFILVINAIIILIADWIMGAHFTVDSFWWALAFSIVLTIINSIFDRLTVNKEHRKDDGVQIFDKDGNRIA
jgi:putative membrane protein